MTVYGLTWTQAAEIAEQLAKKYRKAKLAEQPEFHLLSAVHGEIGAERVKISRPSLLGESDLALHYGPDAVEFERNLIEALRCQIGGATVRADFIDAHETYAAVVDGRKVGFYALHRVGDVLRLDHLWVLPDSMNQGIGRSLFAHGVERARALGFRTVEIESDPNAEGFYRRLGAHRAGTRVSELDGQKRELPVLVYEIQAPCEQPSIS